MESFTYLDFDLQIDRAGSAYRAQVIDSPAGQARRDFELPFERFELDSFLLRLGRTRRATRRIDTPEVEAARGFGSRLFQAVFDDEVGVCLSRSLDEAARQNARLRIRLLLKYAPELANLPWEFLYDPEANRFLALSVNTPLVRYLDLPGRVRPLVVQPPLRALVMISNPSDQADLDVEKEWDRLRRAVEPLELRGALTLERLDEASLAALQRQLRQNQYHIFHFIGHGGFDPGKKDGILVLEDERGRSSYVSSEYLGTILHDHSSLRLAVLNACEGARSADDDPFAGTAQSLVQQGIPAVVAMQFEISDDAAIRFANEFYSSLTVGYPVDAALSEARKSIFTQPNPLEWGTPVLFLRSPDGRIFDVAPLAGSPAPRLPQPEPREKINLEPIYIRALSAFYNERWEQAVILLQQILAAQPGYKDAALKYKQAQVQFQLAQLYEQGNDAWERRAWHEAIVHFEQAQQLDSGYRDVSARLAEAQRLKTLDDLYAEARWLHEAGEWQAVLNIFERIHALDADHPDSDNLLQSSRHGLDEKAQADKLAAMYAEAVLAIDGGRWSDARDQLEAIQAIAPGYEETEGLLERVGEKIALIAKQERDAAEAEARRLAEEEERRRADEAARELAKEQARQRAAEQARQDAEAEDRRRAQAAAAVAYDHGVAHMRAEAWPEAIKQFDQVDRLEPNYRDTAVLRRRAEQAIAGAELERRVAALYAKGNQQMGAGNYADARATFAEILRLKPGYRDTAEILARLNVLGAQPESQAPVVAPPIVGVIARPDVQTDPASPLNNVTPVHAEPATEERIPSDRELATADSIPSGARPDEPSTPVMAVTTRKSRRRLKLVLGGFGLLLVGLVLFQLKANADQRAMIAALATADAIREEEAAATVDAVSQGFAFMGEVQPTASALVHWPVYISEAFAGYTHQYGPSTWYEGNVDDEYWSATFGVRDERYFVDVAEVKQETLALLGATADHYADFDVATTIHRAAGQAGPSMGFQFRRLDPDNHYFFGILDEQQEFYVGFVDDGAWQEDLLLSGTSSDILPGEPNRLAVRATGSHFGFYVNDTLVGELEDDRFSSGAVAVGIHIPAGAQPLTFEIDDFLFHAPDFTSAPTSE